MTPIRKSQIPNPKSQIPLILHIHTLPWVGGSGLNTFLSMKLLDATRFRAVLACSPGGRLEDLVRESGFDFHPVPHLCAEIDPRRDLLALSELVSLIRRVRPAIVHTHNSKAGFLGRLAARMAGKSRVVHTVHGFAFHDRESPGRRALFRNLERLAFRWADAHVAISPALIDWADRERIGRKGDYDLVWSGIEVERFATADRGRGRALLGLKEGTVAVGLVSKLWEGKGHRFLIESLRPILSENLKIVFIGEGPLEQELRAVAGPHVIFAGFQADIPAVTAALDVAVLPSEFEGMGRVLLEAQAAGVPVVANRIGGMVDVVAEGGVLLDAGDAEAWRNAIASTAADPDLRRRMGAAGQAFVNERFSATAMVRSLERIYDRVMEKGHRD